MNALQLYIEKKIGYGNNFDVVKRELGKNVTLYYLSSLADMSLLNNIIEGKIFKKDLLLNSSIVEEYEEKTILNAIYSGCLFVIENECCYIIETRNYPNRSVSESESEKSLKGSHDGFTESILTNTALIRRRIKNEHFKCELFKIGNLSKTDVTINYMDDKVDKQLLTKIKKKIKSLQIESIVLSDKPLSELIFNQKFQVFPKVRFTERPDVASIHILKGYIIILVDTSSSCIITPTTFFELNEQLEEYQLPSLISTFNRVFRLLCFFIGIFLIPIWFLLCLDDSPPQNNFIMLISIDKKKMFIQILSVIIFLNAIRLASFNSTSLLSTSMSLLASVILSNLAVDTGLLVPEVVFYSALSSISTFAISNYEISRSISFWNFILVLAVGFFDKIGFLVVSSILFISLVTIDSKGDGYLYPFIPFDIIGFVKRVFKLPDKKKNI